jgi:predicted anti-sigma-YlaC factor YlaD
MLDVVRATQAVEIDCDVCLMQVGEFAELYLVGKPIPEGLRAIEQHLSICDECREEYEMLCLALRK